MTTSVCEYSSDLNKTLVGYRKKGLKAGEIQRQGGKDVDCAVTRRQI